MAKIVARGYFDERDSSGDLGDFGPTLAVQASKEECDINNIIKKYLRTGELPGLRQGVYADLSQFTDLRDAIHMVNDAEQAFMELPADVRRFFDNDPTKLVEFAQDPANMAKAVELGLAVPRETPQKPVSAPQPSATAPGAVAPGFPATPSTGVPPVST